MIQGDKVGLRTRLDSDVQVFQTELYDDVATRSRSDSRPWLPLPPGAAKSPASVASSDTTAIFTVVRLDSQELVGEALLWGIDYHNRSAHLGISFRPGCRGRGLAVDTVRVLCEYGFAVRGMQRLQIETLADNVPMISAATRAGFTVEGTLRRAAWVYGAFVDSVILGLLAEEWAP